MNCTMKCFLCRRVCDIGWPNRLHVKYVYITRFYIWSLICLKSINDRLGIGSLKLKHHLLYFPVSSLSSAENNNGKSIWKWQNPHQEKTNQILQIYPLKWLPCHIITWFTSEVCKAICRLFLGNGFGRKRNERVTTNKRKTITNKTVNKIYENLFTCSNIGLS